MNNIDPGDASVDVLALLQEQLEARSKLTAVIESTVLLTINVAALAGNAILCFIVCRNPRLRTSTTMLIVALAFTENFSSQSCSVPGAIPSPYFKPCFNLIASATFYRRGLYV